MVVKKIKVVKIPRAEPIKDIPPKFPKLDNLFLEYEEFIDKSLKLSQTSISPTVKPEELPRYNEKGKILDKKTSFEKEFPEDDEDIQDDEDMIKGIGEEEEETRPSNSDDDTGLDDICEEEREQSKEKIPLPQPNKYDGMTPEEIESSKRDKYLNRLKNLRKKWKNRADEVPSFNKHDDYIQIKNAYKSTFNEFILDDKIDNYRMYLKGAFYAAEFVGMMIGIDLEGFAEAQIKIMEKYDRMLIELGEKDINRWNLNLPVEVKLIGFVVLQMGFFWLAKKLGGQEAVDNIFSLVMGVFKKDSREEGKEKEEKKKEKETPRMKGPSINLEDLKRASSKSKETLEE